MCVPLWFLSFLFDQKLKKKFLLFWGVMAHAKWSELTMGSVACLLHVFLLQMILVAIKGLGDKNGSNKSTISNTSWASTVSSPHAHVVANRAPGTRPKCVGASAQVTGGIVHGDGVWSRVLA